MRNIKNFFESGYPGLAKIMLSKILSKCQYSSTMYKRDERSNWSLAENGQVLTRFRFEREVKLPVSNFAKVRGLSRRDHTKKASAISLPFANQIVPIEKNRKRGNGFISCKM